MDEVNARELLTRLGCRRIRVFSGEIRCSCPFPDGHARGDRRPSYSAAINDADKSPYWCFGCHARGTLEGLAAVTGHGDLVPEAVLKKVERKPFMQIPQNNVGRFRRFYQEEEKPVLYRDIYLKPFVGVLSGYLKKRGIELETAKAWELGLDRHFRRATFTVRDMDGRLALVIGRDVTGRSRVKYSNYVLDRRDGVMVPFIDHEREEDFVPPTKKFFLYGEHKAGQVLKSEGRGEGRDLIVVEGAIDVLNLWQMGFNPVAVLGSYPSKVQTEKLVSLVPPSGRLIVMADGDKAGRKLTEEIGKKLGDRVPVLDAQLGEGRDPGEATKEEIDEALKKASVIRLTPNR